MRPSYVQREMKQLSDKKQPAVNQHDLDKYSHVLTVKYFIHQSAENIRVCRTNERRGHYAKI